MLSATAYTSSDLCANRPRTAKHLTERKRRARINDSLLQLKSMVFPAVRKDISRHPKMEKADILEMTVRYLKDVQTHPRDGSQPVAGVTQYHAGFTECLSEVSNFMSTCESIDIETRLRLLGHLADRCSTINEPDQKPDVQHQRVAATPSPVTVPASSPIPVIQPQQSHPQQGGMVILVPAQTVQPLPTATPVISVKVPGNDNLLTPPQSPISPDGTPGATRLTPSPIDVKPSKRAIDLHNQRFNPYQKHQQVKAVEKSMWRPW
ncbi:transcription factor HES-4-like [Diadema setosum]|uniref:transcription factor HES-4-like n=1 Tax=Diadema setosum TaxID=31175 RepID=UPI003B3A9A22